MSKVVKDKFKHLIIYLISFAINYMIFIFLMLFVSENSAVGINIVNLIAWIVSMVFIFFVDKKYVPDLVDENKDIDEIIASVKAEKGVDIDEAMKRVSETPVGIHCWQGDDVAGFESPDGNLTGGIQSTGDYPGKARNIDELRALLVNAFLLIYGYPRPVSHVRGAARQRIKERRFARVGIPRKRKF